MQNIIEKQQTYLQVRLHHRYRLLLQHELTLCCKITMITFVDNFLYRAKQIYLTSRQNLELVQATIKQLETL